jgi:hypothetical protein
MSLWENSGEFINEMFCVVAIVENLLMVQARALLKYTPPILASIRCIFNCGLLFAGI